MTFDIPPQNNEKITEKFAKANVADVQSVLTSKGSVYNYLSDGQTQRFKKVENKLYEPRSALVYIPDIEWIKANAPAEVLQSLGDNSTSYNENLLEYIQATNKNCYLVDKDGKKLEKNQELQTTKGPIFLTFGIDNKVDFMLPVTVNPTIGFYTYDSRKYIDEETGVSKRERHMGNQVVEITLKKK